MLLSLQTVCCVILMFSTSIGSSMCFFSQMGCQCMNPTFTFTVVSDLGCIDAWIQYSPSLWSLTLIASMKYAASTSSSVDMEWSTSSHISIPSSIVFCVSSAPLKFLFCQQVWLHMCSFQSLDYTYTIVSRFFAINVFFELVTIVFPKTIRTKKLFVPLMCFSCWCGIYFLFKPIYYSPHSFPFGNQAWGSPSWTSTKPPTSQFSASCILLWNAIWQLNGLSTWKRDRTMNPDQSPACLCLFATFGSICRSRPLPLNV